MSRKYDFNLSEQLGPVNMKRTQEEDRLRTADFLTKVACFVRKVNNIFNIKTKQFEPDQPTVLSRFRRAVRWVVVLRLSKAELRRAVRR